MKITQPTLRHSALTAVFACLLVALAHAETVSYIAQPTGSSMKMDGTSTIHDWTMESATIGGSIEADARFPDSALSDPKAARPSVQAFLPVRSLKSDSKRMDEVMQKHMNATTHPKIEYRVIELKPKSAAGTTGALQFDAVGALTIAGQTRTNTMPVTIEKLADKKLKISGTADLKMTDYGVEPPAPSILGLSPIKTGDEVKLTFVWVTAPKAP